MRAQLVEYDELNIVRAAAGGDCDAFDILISRYGDQIFRLALRMLGNREDAEDVRQETFVQAYRRLKGFRGDSAFGTWLYAIASRLCLSRLRRARNRFEVVELDEFAAGGESPEGRLLAAEAARRVQAALGRLAPQDRLLIVLKFVEGLSHEEIAGVLGCSPESSRSRLLRAKRIFRGIFEQME